MQTYILVGCTIRLCTVVALWIDEQVYRTANLRVVRKVSRSIGDHNSCVSVVVKVLKKFHRVRVESVLIASFLPRLIQNGSNLFGISVLKSDAKDIPCITC